MKIAIVGSGISGLGCAYLLQQQHDITLFEAENRIGGHTHTFPVQTQEGTQWIDTGFIVFNKLNYPNFTKLLEHLQIQIQPTEMSFSVHVAQTGLEYNGHDINGLFSQRKNLFKKTFWQLLWNIYRFNQAAKQLIYNTKQNLTFKDFYRTLQLSDPCWNYYLAPMLSAIWSCDLDKVSSMPAWFICKFLDNHGLLNIQNRPQWYTLVGGSHVYVKKILEKITCEILTETPVVSIDRHAQGVTIKTKSDSFEFDAVILATHSDQALSLISNITAEEQQALATIPYLQNQVTLHTDTALLPKNKRAWASWNYLLCKQNTTTVTYNMNILQRLNCDTTYCVSLNQIEKVNPEKIIETFNYAHPLYSLNSLAGQKKIQELNGKNRTFYCGAYCGYGFHEDGLTSALRVVQKLDPELLCKAPYFKV